MNSRRSLALGAVALVVAVGTAVSLSHSGAARAAAAEATSLRVQAGAEDGWASRTVWACDRRKAVVVEGVAPDQKLPPNKAQQVADILTDLMHYCNAEAVARIAVDERVTLSVNGLPFVEWVPGSASPVQLAHGKVEHDARERAIWQAELDRTLKEGDRLFHSDELGSNGLACAMCHPDASNTHPETYPKFQTQLKKVALLRDMVNWCIMNPLEGKELPDGDPRLKALEAYILVKRTGVALDPGKH
jgi:thiosulfate dehydrogenase